MSRVNNRLWASKFVNLQAINSGDGDILWRWEIGGIHRSPARVRLKALVSLKICKSRSYGVMVDFIEGNICMSLPYRGI